ncbi:MAG TPA: response regulator [Bradyrhizobium sp.]|uniref:response regulator transcription factor n=1 Tax=Bradyrhizobium sp. TaxID=376 RepID=UPI002C1B9FE6|nr:response regulator [Bradyrhizobium sp.]HLZ01164.1 response regulator [Bradyrhizobium sp.]
MNNVVRSRSPETAGDLLITTPVVYVVDDNTDVLGSLRFLLETDGFQVRTFRSGEALLNTTTIGLADCFVIDYKMPSMTGIDLAAALRSREITTPIILITGFPDKTIPAKATGAGIGRVLLKPLVEESLVACVREAIERDRPPAGR